MAHFLYKIEIFSDWHCGSGLTSGSDVDLLVIKDKNGFPYLPGKTLKGLLKDGAMDLKDAGILNENSIVNIFGREAEREGSKLSIPGKAYFSNGELTQYLKNRLEDKTEHLYRKISSTAIDGSGLAKEHSLRRIEVTVPLVFFAKIDNVDPEKDMDVLGKCMKMVKRLGTGRNRGFGRCELSIVNGGEQ